MSPLEVTQVESRADLNAFIKFPWRIYKNDPAWVPPLIIERKEFLSRKHPFYEHGDSALFLARSGGELVGRIMVSDDPNYNALHKTNVGCFGLFESIDDPAVATALFEVGAAWLRARGRDEIMGPIDYSTNYVCGLLVDGFKFPPMLLTSHNPPYYSALIERWGFEKTMDLYAWWFANPAEAAALISVNDARVEFRHPLVGSAVYQGAPLSRRLLLQLRHALSRSADPMESRLSSECPAMKT